jgi:hypothetical protein
LANIGIKATASEQFVDLIADLEGKTRDFAVASVAKCRVHVGGGIGDCGGGFSVSVCAWMMM